MTQGPVEQTIIRQCVTTGRALPTKIANAPELLPGLELYFVAFQDLHTCRSAGFDVGPIAWLDIDRYADQGGLDEDQRQDLHHHVRAMDNAYLAWARQQAKTK